MLPADQYELLDFGRGRKLECLGGVLVDRPSPVAAGHTVAQAALWSMARARFSRRDARTGVWSTSHDFPATWLVRRQTITLELRPTPSGAVGLYPEQAANWDWIGDRIRAERRPVKVLNLFAYTGASTLAAAGAGADEVVHVDAARGVVAWARRNARLSDLTARPIRWIVEDSRKFVERELRRGNAYQGIILDPPTYGHGPRAGLETGPAPGRTAAPLRSLDAGPARVHPADMSRSRMGAGQTGRSAGQSRAGLLPKRNRRGILDDPVTRRATACPAAHSPAGPGDGAAGPRENEGIADGADDRESA